MGSLGQYLVQEGLCTSDQLERALDAQVVYGGKLGTILLEQGAVDLQSLGKALGRIHKVRALDPMQPIRIRNDVVHLIPPRFAAQYSVVPLSLDGRRLYLLMMDPREREPLQKLAQGLKLEVVPVVLPEVRLRILLERYYGVEQDLRYLTLARNLAANEGRIPAQLALGATSQDEDLMPEEVFEEQVSHMRNVDGGTGVAVVDREQFAAEDEAELLEVSEDDIIPIDAEEDEDWASYMEPTGGAEPGQLESEVGAPEDFRELSLVEEEAPPLDPVDLSEAQQLLTGATDRDDIAAAVIRLARKTFARGVLFIVRGGAISGWDAFGEGINLPVVRNVIVSLRQPSVFKLVSDTRAHFLGQVPPGDVNEAFLKLLGGPPPKSVFLYPILFKGKVVNLFYGDGGPGKNAPVDVSDLLILGPKIPQTFDRILRERKARMASASGGR